MDKKWQQFGNKDYVDGGHPLPEETSSKKVIFTKHIKSNNYFFDELFFEEGKIVHAIPTQINPALYGVVN
jgi:hypothetical protein